MLELRTVSIRNQWHQAAGGLESDGGAPYKSGSRASGHMQTGVAMGTVLDSRKREWDLTQA